MLFLDRLLAVLLMGENKWPVYWMDIASFWQDSHGFQDAATEPMAFHASMKILPYDLVYNWAVGWAIYSTNRQRNKSWHRILIESKSPKKGGVSR